MKNNVNVGICPATGEQDNSKIVFVGSIIFVVFVVIVIAVLTILLKKYGVL